jgi:hypothetical protein
MRRVLNFLDLIDFTDFKKGLHGFFFTPLEIMPRCSAAGLDFRIIQAGFNALLEFLTGFTFNAVLICVILP